MKVTIVVPTIRTNNCSFFIKGLKSNKIEYEVLFLGPNKPDFDLPKNFHFIQTNVKPPQCLEAGTRLAKGELIMYSGDDFSFIEDNPLDKLYDEYVTIGRSDVLLSTTFAINGVSQLRQPFVWFDQYATASVGLMSREFHIKMGGLDKNFIAVLADADLHLRIWESGGKVVISDIVCSENFSLGSRLFNTYGNEDHTTLVNLWKYCPFSLKRTKLLSPFADDNILNITQGPKGEWHET